MKFIYLVCSVLCSLCVLGQTQENQSAYFGISKIDQSGDSLWVSILLKTPASPKSIEFGFTGVDYIAGLNSGVFFTENFDVEIESDNKIYAYNLKRNTELTGMVKLTNALFVVSGGETEICLRGLKLNTNSGMEVPAKLWAHKECISIEKVEKSHSISFNTLQIDNKSSGYYEIKGADSFKAMKVYNDQGALMLASSIMDDNKQTVDISKYPKGNYFLRLEGSENYSTVLKN